MKNILITISVLVFLSCKAQNIVPIFLEDGSQIQDTYQTDYYKDVDNDFNPYIGRWKWEDGNTSLEIIFNKVVHGDSGGGDFSDDLVGEYKYVENGVELVNSFPNPLINDIVTGVPNIVNEDNSITSYDIKTNNSNSSFCPECPNNTRYIFLLISDYTISSDIWGGIIMARFVEGGVEKIRMRIYNKYNRNNNGVKISVPENSILTLIKQ